LFRNVSKFFCFNSKKCSLLSFQVYYRSKLPKIFFIHFKVVQNMSNYFPVLKTPLTFFWNVFFSFFPTIKNCLLKISLRSSFYRRRPTLLAVYSLTHAHTLSLSLSLSHTHTPAPHTHNKHTHNPTCNIQRRLLCRSLTSVVCGR